MLSPLLRMFHLSTIFPSTSNSHNPLFHGRNGTASSYHHPIVHDFPAVLIVLEDIFVIRHFYKKNWLELEKMRTTSDYLLTFCRYVPSINTELSYIICPFSYKLSNRYPRSHSLVMVISTKSIHSNFVKNQSHK